MQSKTKVMFVLGTRPEAIKLFPLIEIYKIRDNYEVIVISTGQQREMLKSTMDSLGLVCDYDLDLMVDNQTLAYLTSVMFTKFDEMVKLITPKILFIHGDTTTSMVAGLVAKYNKIRVVHIEAGLRTNDIFSPWPEELNRRINSISSDYHISPTASAKKNLLNEGIKEELIFVSGNTGIDTVKSFLSRLNDKDFFKTLILDICKNTKIDFDKIILITIHRRENFQILDQIFESLIIIANRYREHTFIYPVHLNPNVSRIAHQKLSGFRNVFLVEPIEYSKFITILSKSIFVITDSGGIQEEASYLGKPIVLIRNKTERPEGLKTGNIIMAGTNTESIVFECDSLIQNSSYYEVHSSPSMVFGDGNASRKILDWLEVIFDKQ